MTFHNMSQIIVRKYRNICRVWHINRSSGYPCNINTQPIDSNPFKYTTNAYYTQDYEHQWLLQEYWHL